MPYPTPPAPRIPYDIDGSVGIFGPGQTVGIQDLGTSGLAAMNSDQADYVWTINNRTNGNQGTGLYSVPWPGPSLQGTPFSNFPNFVPMPFAAVIFPRPMQLMAFLGGVLSYAEGTFATPYGGATTLQGFSFYTSTDTTNGMDGTWTKVFDTPSPMMPPGVRSGSASEPPMVKTDSQSLLPGGSLIGSWDVNPSFRRAGDADPNGYGWRVLSGAGLRNVVAVRIVLDKYSVDPTFFYNSNTWNLAGFGAKLHLYGVPETSYDPNWLKIIPAMSGAVSLDMGDVAQGATVTKSFTVKNTSATLGAHGISLSVNAPNAAPIAPISAPVAQLSLDGVAWATTLSLPDLAAGASSATIQVRATAPAANTVGVWSPRVSVSAGSWS